MKEGLGHKKRNKNRIVFPQGPYEILQFKSKFEE